MLLQIPPPASRLAVAIEQKSGDISIAFPHLCQYLLALLIHKR
jgi:hypothetical protein